MRVQTQDIKTGEAIAVEQVYSFPHQPHPVVIKAKSLEEAQEKFANITKKAVVNTK